MPDAPEPNDLHNLDALTDRLYRRDLAGQQPKRFDALHPHKALAPHDWEAPSEKPKGIAAVRPSYFKRFFFISLGVALLAIIVAAFIFFTGGNTVSNNNIDIKVLGNSFTAGGDQLPLQLEVVNRNSTQLELADVFVEYDKGASADSGASHIRDRYTIGSLASGKTFTKNIFVTLYGQENQVQNVDLTLQYHIAGSNAVFVKKQSFPVTISSTPVALSIDGPTTIAPNQELSFTVKVKSNAKDTVPGMLLKVEYPTGFSVKTTSEDPVAFDNVWDIGDLAPNAERDITITGIVRGQDGEDRNFRATVGAASADDKTTIGITYNSLLQDVSIVKPFLAADLSINGSADSTVSVASGSTVQGTVAWSNTLSTAITGAEITVTLSGNALDAGTIKAPDGFYNSNNNTIVWNSTTDPDLTSIQPGDHGTLTFSFSVVPLVSGSTTITKPSVKLAVSIKGKQPDQGGAVTTVSDFQEKTAIVSSDLGFSEDALYQKGPFTNTGSIPPIAGQPTTYTITWTITNSSNALANGLATSTLPVYMDWVGTKSPASENIQYDATTRAIRWNFGSVPTGAGSTTAAKTVSFQVRLNPSRSQVGSSPNLILDTTVSAVDTYTKETLHASHTPLTTRLDNDTGFPVGGATVIQ